MHGPLDVQRVVLVVLDGLRADAIDAFGLGHIAGLAAGGASTRAARTVTPSVTAAAVTSLCTGVSPGRHGVVSDRFHIPRRLAIPDPVPRRLAAAGYPCAVFMGRLPRVFTGLARRIGRGMGVDRIQCEGEHAREVLAAAGPTLATLKHGLVVLHWADADRAGHVDGWMSPAYAAGARALDEALGELAATLALEREPSTLLIAVADHGGGGVVATDHESTHPLDQTIPLVLAGPAVEPGSLLPSATLLDIPPTILWALDVACPSAYEGRPLMEAFRPAAVAA